MKKIFTADIAPDTEAHPTESNLQHGAQSGLQKNRPQLHYFPDKDLRKAIKEGKVIVINPKDDPKN